MSNLPVPRDPALPAVPDPAMAAMPGVYAYPITRPAPASIGDATALLQRVLDIVGRFGDEIQAATLRPYPCAVCQIDMARWAEWQWRRHFNSHPLADRARVLGWFRAVMGT